MYERRFGLDEITGTRFAISPLWELVASVRVLGRAADGVHRPWTARARTALRDARVDMSRLHSLIPVNGHIADFLTPTPPRRMNGFEDELHRLASTRDRAVHRDIELLATTARGRSSRVLEEARADPDRFLSQVIDELEQYWQVAIAPFWPRLRGVAEEDIAWRLENIAEHGTRTALGTLNTRVRLTGEHMVVHGTCAALDPAEPGAGVVLVPCSFTWPEILLLDAPAMAPTIGYASRGVGNLWRTDPDHSATLPELIGRTRATLLHMLDLPATTTDLAQQLGLAEPTTNSHLQILYRSGMIRKRRSGKFVYYDRTALGTGLLTGAQDAGR